MSRDKSEGVWRWRIATVRRFLLIVSLSLAFGGFTFYAAVVVPIGGEVTDATTQGFVTQRVTHRLNAAMVAAVVMIACEWLATRRRRSKAGSRALLSSTIVLGLCCLALFLVHPRLDALLESSSFTVNEPDRFYRWHQVYLWTSSLQWATCLVVIGLLASEWSNTAMRRPVR